MGSSRLRQAMQTASGGEDIRTAMLGFYEELPYDHAESYQFLFEELLAGNVPLVFNCAAGKDRTGVAAALVLGALGVPRDHILEDYSLTERLVDFEALVMQGDASDQTTGFNAIRALPREIRAPVLRSDPDYLASALDAIDRREGSLDDFLARQFGVGLGEREALRELLLEPQQG
jgi:protein-tyrosine phosphatase